MTAGVEFAGLHHVQLSIPAGTEPACRTFWVDAVGLTEVEKPATLAGRGGCWFRGGGLELHLGVDPDFRANAKAHPGILVHGLSSLAARLEDHGIAVSWDAELPGFRRFYANDPLGNRLEFLEPVVSGGSTAG